MTADQALTWLTTTAQKTCDTIGNKGSPRPWNLSDVEAVHALQRMLVTRAQPLTPAEDS